nr:unnamed protein product [Callosobruchus chinensis]
MASERSNADIPNSVIAQAVDEELGVDTGVKENATLVDNAIRRSKYKSKVQRQNSKDNVVASNFVHGPRSWKNSRRSRNGYGRGLPKKGGAGGKGVWGKPGSELLETYEDINDPNFDNENMSNGDIELKVVVPEVSNEEIKKKVEPIVLEYFENGDTQEAILSIEEQIPWNRRDALVEQLIEIALDHKPSHREMTSVLISDLFPHVISEPDISKAFESLLANINDLKLDVPDAPTIIGNFIARYIMKTYPKNVDKLIDSVLSGNNIMTV